MKLWLKKAEDTGTGKLDATLAAADVDLMWVT